PTSSPRVHRGCSSRATTRSITRPCTGGRDFAYPSAILSDPKRFAMPMFQCKCAHFRSRTIAGFFLFVFSTGAVARQSVFVFSKLNELLTRQEAAGGNRAGPYRGG